MKTSPNMKARALKQADRIGVVSPASRPADEQLLMKGIEYLRNLGYSVDLGKNVLNQRGYLAGEDVLRADDVNAMFADPGIKAVFCSRGGYGAPRILDQIDFETIRKNPKIFIGYSDITSMNLAIWAKTGLVTFSGPMVAVEMGKGIDKFTEKSLWENLKVTKKSKKLKNPKDKEIQVIKQGQAEGPLISGCLSVFQAIIGTPYMPEISGAILVLEDIEEEPYRVDRYFAQFKLSGLFDRINALILGDFIDCVPRDPAKPALSVDEVILDYVGHLKIPVIKNFAYGHGSVKLTLPLGIQARVDTSKNYIRLLENTVE